MKDLDFIEKSLREDQTVVSFLLIIAFIGNIVLLGVVFYAILH